MSGYSALNVVSPSIDDQVATPPAKRFSFASQKVATPAPALSIVPPPVAPLPVHQIEPAAEQNEPPIPKFSFGKPTPAAEQNEPPIPKFSFGKAASAVSSDELVSRAAREQIPDEVIGMLQDLQMYNDWGRGKVVESSTGKVIKITGTVLKDLHIGGRYKFSGKIGTKDPKYGPQLEVRQVLPDVESLDALIDHMVRNFKNIGIDTAKKVAEYHRQAGSLSALKNALIHRPSTVDFSQFSNRQITLKDDEDSQKRRVRDSLSIRFSGMGISQNVMAALSTFLMQRAQAAMTSQEGGGRDLVSLSNKILDDNPYKPMQSVERYGFQTADMIAGKLNIEGDDPRRISAMVSYALGEGCANSGHMYLDRQNLFRTIREIDRKSTMDPAEAIDLAIKNEEPMYEDYSMGDVRYYTKAMRKAESMLVDHLSMRLTTEVEPLSDLSGQELEDLINGAVATVASTKGQSDFKLDPSQTEALRGILTSRCSLHTLTAGPGCGKTAIVEVLMEAVGPRLRTTFCAPIGKAAKVLNSRIKKWGTAKTIHSTLEYTGEFNRNGANPLETDLVIADEQSMLGGPLGAAFFDAVPAKAHIIMLGDVNQLAPIEPGRVLKSVLELDGLDHHRLTITHRNKGSILEVVNEVGGGNCVSRSRGDVEFSPLQTPDEFVFKALAHEVQQAAVKQGGLDRIGVICPVRKGNQTLPGWNVTYLNTVLRDVINPDDEANSKKIVGTSFRQNDRIIVNKNMTIPLLGIVDRNAPLPAPRLSRITASESDPDCLGDGFDEVAEESLDDDTYVVNGDTGWLEDVEYAFNAGCKQPSKLILRLDDDRRVSFPAAELENLSLSYAITVHAAQGSEYGKVFGVVTDGMDSFMHRAMIFTMFSRAQSELKIFGDQSVLAKISARPAPERNCALVERTLRDVTQVMGERIETVNTQHDRSNRLRQG